MKLKCQKEIVKGFINYLTFNLNKYRNKKIS